MPTDDATTTELILEELRRRDVTLGDDFKVINGKVNIRCFEPKAHNNGDANPSAYYHLGKYVVCRVCDLKLGQNRLAERLGVSGIEDGLSLSQLADAEALPKPKVLPVRPDSIPTELKDWQQWVCWRLIRKNGKWTKPPHRADGSNADVAQPGTWTSFAIALSGYETGRFAGVGFVLTEADPYVGIDLDKCRNPDTGQIEDWALAIVRAVPTYWELSPSGTGLRAIGRAQLPPGRRRKRNIEMYDAGRYLTITGHLLELP
jgi:hypothetical protein